MLNERGVEVGDFGQGQFQHHQLICWQGVKLLGQRRTQQNLGRALLDAVDVDFRFDDGYETGLEDLSANRELLVDHGSDACLIGQGDH